MSELLRTKEVAALTGVPEATLRWFRHMDDGRGPRSGRLGGRVVYRRQDVLDWIDSAFTDDHQESA